MAGGGETPSEPPSQPMQPMQLNPPEADELSLLLHQAMLCTAYNFEHGAAYHELAALAVLRIAHGAVGSSQPDKVGRMGAPQCTSMHFCCSAREAGNHRNNFVVPLNPQNLKLRCVQKKMRIA